MILKHCETVCFSGKEYRERTRGIESRPRGDSLKVCAQHQHALKFIYKVHEMCIILLLWIVESLFEYVLNGNKCLVNC